MEVNTVPIPGLMHGLNEILMQERWQPGDVQCISSDDPSKGSSESNQSNNNSHYHQ